jgi:glutamine cyclotransferase
LPTFAGLPPVFQIAQKDHNIRYTTNTTEGWGITFDASRHELLVSDGSEWIHVWDATTLLEKRRYAVTFQTNPQQPRKVVKHLNELEFDATTDTLLANVWYQNVLLRIDLNSGQVLRVYDMSQLYPYDQARSIFQSR